MRQPSKPFWLLSTTTHICWDNGKGRSLSMVWLIQNILTTLESSLESMCCPGAQLQLCVTSLWPNPLDSVLLAWMSFFPKDKAQHP